MNFNEIIEKNIAIHCKSEGEYKSLFILYGLKDKEIYKNQSNSWSRYREETCYTIHFDDYGNFNYFRYADKNWYQDNNFDIIEFEDLVKSIELKPCPFCGGKAIVKNFIYPDLFFVECQKCYSNSPASIDIKTITENWNNRV